MPENKGLPIFSTPPPLLSPQHTQLKKIMGVIVCLQRIQERTTKNEITRTEKQEPRREDQPLIVLRWLIMMNTVLENGLYVA